MTIMLDPAHLPKLDVLSLAQNGLILRAERETPKGSIPCFLTRAGWEELIAHHKTTPEETEAQIGARLLPALERICARLLSEAAKEAEQQHKEDATVFTLQTDLFPSSAQTRLVFVADKTHPVACALIGTVEHINHLLSTSGDIVEDA